VFLLTAPSATLTGLAYAGPTTDHGMAVLRFTLAGANVTGLALTGACTNARAVRVTTPSGATAGITLASFDAVSIAFTYGVASYVFTAVAPPPDSFAIASGSVVSLSIEGTTLSSSGLVLHSPATNMVSC
jgi:hypothetical protein